MNNSRNFTQSQAGLFLLLGTIIPIAVVSILTSNACLAQIIPDTTLGNESSRITTGVNIKEHGADLIEGGAQRGSSLFHSFAEFNVNNGQRVYFANPTGIANILSRVTGGNASNILGTLGVNGAANLFLLNPNGIIFGPNAQLDIQGSFLATTANSFKFPDGSEFSATNPQAPPLLTMSVPVGVQYGLQQTASITNQGNLVTGKDLTLSAGNLDLQGTLQAGGDLILQAQDTLKVRDSASNPFIAAAGGNLLAQGNQKVDIFALNNPNSGFFSGGNIYLNSKEGGIDIKANIISEAPNGIAGSVTIQALGDISVSNSSIKAISNNDIEQYKNNITINSTKGSLDLNRSQLDTTNNGSGYAGYIIINASDKISLLNGSKIFSQGNNGLLLIGINLIISTDNDGAIIFDVDPNKIYAPKNVIIDNSEINTNSNDLDKADSNDLDEAGGIMINASEKISLLNGSKISSQGNEALLLIGINDKILLDAGVIELQLSGVNDIDKPKSIIIDNSEINTGSTNDSENAGNIRINASDKISILNGSNISSQGNDGQIFIGSDDKISPTKSVTIDNSFLSTDNVSSSGGNAGNIKIYAIAEVSIKKSNIFSGRGKDINTQNSNTDNSTANGGTVDITSKGLISLENSRILSDVFSSDENGSGGKINISASSLIIKDNSELDTSTSGTGNAGDVSINVFDSISLKNSVISSSVIDTATGRAGNINIKTHSLTADKGRIEARSQGQGDGGNIKITTPNLLLRRQSKISTTAGAVGLGGNGGSITIDAKDGFVVADPTEDSDIIANSFGGQGGKIKITANRVLGFQNRGKLTSAELKAIENNGTSDISASSDVIGADGEVAIETLSIDPSQGLVALPTTLVDPSRLIAQGCGSGKSNVAKGQSEFVITGRGGLPPSPDDTLKAGDILPEWVVNNTVNHSNNSENMTVKEMNLRQLSSNTPAPLVEAVGMVHTANGDILLTAQPTTATLVQSGLSTKVCGAVQGNVRE